MGPLIRILLNQGSLILSGGSELDIFEGNDSVTSLAVAFGR